MINIHPEADFLPATTMWKGKERKGIVRQSLKFISHELFIFVKTHDKYNCFKRLNIIGSLG